MSFKSGFTTIALAVFAACGAWPAQAQPASGDDDLRRKVEELQKQLDALKAQLQSLSQTPPAAAAASPAASPAPAPAMAGAEPIQRKPGEGLTILTRGGEATIYGVLDVSVDDSSKGLDGMTVGGVPPAGRMGWMPDISTNLSYVGIRGFQSLGDFPARFVYQLETQIDLSASSGLSASNSNTSDVVKGGLTSRNTFIGLASPGWGALKIGKSDAPYKTSTAMMNPFSGMWGDYSVIMGNTGGDNRVEFGTRFDHAIWYESPVWNGLQFNLLVAPGQNRAYDNSNLAAGEVDCAGGNIPGSGGTPAACNDGAFGSAYSTNLSYRIGDLYATAAYELHRGVNRTSDLPAWDAGDVADEWAAKIGAQYRFAGTNTTVSGIVERLVREDPVRLAYQNERTRSGTWLAVTQGIGPWDNVSLGWAHAGQAEGDPGQHNTPGGSGSDNASNMFTIAWKHQVDRNLSVYTDFAETLNHASAHYDLGAGGRGVTTDCHDASNPDASGFDPNGDAPHCWAGGHLKGISVGAHYTY